jgi:uridine monophosphate synthetase
MSFYEKLAQAVDHNDSLLCVGLDPVTEQLPDRYRSSTADLMADLLRWNLAIIEETRNLVCTYKPNIAFYEALGAAGMDLLRKTLAAIPAEIPVILDAKRGDIGSTATAYAKACFEDLGVDAVTLSPYLGRDSVDPFAAYADRGLFVLCHTSNPSAGEFQTLSVEGRPLYLHVAETAIKWSPNVGLVVGATYPEALRTVRAVAPHAWLLVPGIGAQGGAVAEAIPAGVRADGSGLIVNVARGVTLAEDHGAAARQIRDEINNTRR